MSRKILILTQDVDPHVHPVADALQRRGVQSMRFDLGDFPEHVQFAASIGQRGWQGPITWAGQTDALEDIQSIWYRHQRLPDPSRAYPPHVRTFVQAENLRGLLGMLQEGAHGPWGRWRRPRSPAPQSAPVAPPAGCWLSDCAGCAPVHAGSLRVPPAGAAPPADTTRRSRLAPQIHRLATAPRLPALAAWVARTDERSGSCRISSRRTLDRTPLQKHLLQPKGSGVAQLKACLGKERAMLFQAAMSSCVHQHGHLQGEKARKGGIRSQHRFNHQQASSLWIHRLPAAL